MAYQIAPAYFQNRFQQHIDSIAAQTELMRLHRVEDAARETLENAEALCAISPREQAEALHRLDILCRERAQKIVFPNGVPV